MARIQIQVEKKKYLYIIYVKRERMGAIRRSIKVNKPHAVIDHRKIYYSRNAAFLFWKSTNLIGSSTVDY